MSNAWNSVSSNLTRRSEYPSFKRWRRPIEPGSNMRPIYETDTDLDRESGVIGVVEKAWNCTAAKLPIRYHLDYVLKRGDKAVAFCEIKTRNYTMQKIGEMGGYLMSIGKWSSAKQLSNASLLPFILIAKTLDGVYYSSFQDSFKPDDVLVRGRTDRNDWQDIEPCVLIHVHRFKKLNINAE